MSSFVFASSERLSRIAYIVMNSSNERFKIISQKDWGNASVAEIFLPERLLIGLFCKTHLMIIFAKSECSSALIPWKHIKYQVYKIVTFPCGFWQFFYLYFIPSLSSGFSTKNLHFQPKFPRTVGMRGNPFNVWHEH